MKYIMIVGDGMCDRPLKQLDGKTPLQVARKPNMDKIAKEGMVGITKTIPHHLTPASDVANLSLLGYDPKKYYTGRAPLEAANMGVALAEKDVAFRCNLVTIFEERMEDYSAGHIKDKEAKILINFLGKKIGSKNIQFYPGVSYRHLVVFNTDNLKIDKDDLIKTICTPPHDITGERIQRYMPRGKASEFLADLMNKSKDFLITHDVNRVRIDLGENPANMIWLWGQGTSVNIPSFKQMFNMTGSIISAVDLIKGIGRTIGLEPIEVPGATGYYDTNFSGKAEYAINSLKDKDFVFIHIEAPDEAGHNGDIRSKILSIENIDRFVVGAVLDHFNKTGEDYRILVTSDHATPIALKTHSRDPIFFAVYGSGIEKDKVDGFDEFSAASSTLNLKQGSEIINILFKK